MIEDKDRNEMIEIRDLPYPSEDNKNGDRKVGKTFVDVYCWDEKSQFTWDRRSFEHLENLPGYQEDLVSVRLPGIFKQEEWSKPAWWAFWRKPELLEVAEESGTFFSYARPGKKFKRWFWFDSEEMTFQLDNPVAESLREWAEVDEAQCYYNQVDIQMAASDACSLAYLAIQGNPGDGMKLLKEGLDDVQYGRRVV